MDYLEIKEAVGANEIILIQEVGGTVYGVSNPRDKDMLVIVDRKKDHWQYFSESMDFFVYSLDEYKESLKGSPPKTSMRQLCAFLNHEAAKLNLKNSVYYGECEGRGISLYDNKKEVFQRVIKFGDKNFFSPHISNRYGNHGCAKLMSWALWYYYAFQNGSLELTKEQQNTIQLCHDGNLPIEYAKDLRQKIMGIINE